MRQRYARYHGALFADQFRYGIKAGHVSTTSVRIIPVTNPRKPRRLSLGRHDEVLASQGKANGKRCTVDVRCSPD